MIHKIWRNVKLLKMRIFDDVSHLKTDIKLNKKWYGNEYGGFFIHPDIISSDSIVYSFGIGEDISFDLDIIQKHNCSVHGFDPTPKSIDWIKQNCPTDKFIFHKYGISDKSGYETFYLPKNPNHISGSATIQDNINTQTAMQVEMKKLSDIMEELHHTHIDILKIDIEGSEYNVIDNILESGILAKQLLIEFHDRFISSGRDKSKQTVNKLHNAGYKIFGISKSLEEVSFIHQTEFSS